MQEGDLIRSLPLPAEPCTHVSRSRALQVTGHLRIVMALCQTSSHLFGSLRLAAPNGYVERSDWIKEEFSGGGSLPLSAEPCTHVSRRRAVQVTGHLWIVISLWQNVLRRLCLLRPTLNDLSGVSGL